MGAKMKDQIREALEKIKAKEGFCIYGSSDTSDDPDVAFRQGSAYAFNECAEIAKEALSTEPKQDEREKCYAYSDTLGCRLEHFEKKCSCKAARSEDTVEYWKAKYLEARQSGYAEGLEEMKAVIEFYAHLEGLAELGCKPEIGNSRIATEALAAIKSLEGK
jgi:hypothetical protein